MSVPYLIAKKETKLCDAYSTRRTSLPAFGGVQSIVISADKDFTGCKPMYALEADMTPCFAPNSGHQTAGQQCPLGMEGGRALQTEYG
jgi:hypothetical protein